MLNPKSLFWLVVILLIIGGIAGWFIYHDLQNPVELSENGSLAIVREPFSDRMPNLDKEIIVKAEIAEEYKGKLINEINEIRAALKEDYDNLGNWLQLGLLFKAAEDYEGAREAWEFAALIRPKDGVAFHNLGDLYWMYLPDFPRSEKYFLKSIENSPHPLTYQKLHELYRYSYKEKADFADDVLLQGIEANPSEPYLMVVLAEYYEETGSLSEAVLYYEKALKLNSANELLRKKLEDLKKEL